MTELDYRQAEDEYYRCKKQRDRAIELANQVFWDRTVEAVGVVAKGTTIRTATENEDLKVIEKVGLMEDYYGDPVIIFYAEGTWYDLDGYDIKHPVILAEL